MIKRTAALTVLAALTLAGCGGGAGGSETPLEALTPAAAPPVEATTTTVPAPAPVAVATTAPKPAAVKPAVVKPAPVAITTTTAPPAPVTTVTTAAPVVETTTTTTAAPAPVVEAGWCSLAVAKSPVATSEKQTVTLTSNRPGAAFRVTAVSYNQSPQPTSQTVTTDAAGGAVFTVTQGTSYSMSNPNYQQARVSAGGDGASCIVKYDVA